MSVGMTSKAGTDPHHVPPPLALFSVLERIVTSATDEKETYGVVQPPFCIPVDGGGSGARRNAHFRHGVRTKHVAIHDLAATALLEQLF